MNSEAKRSTIRIEAVSTEKEQTVFWTLKVQITFFLAVIMPVLMIILAAIQPIFVIFPTSYIFFECVFFQFVLTKITYELIRDERKRVRKIKEAAENKEEIAGNYGSPTVAIIFTLLLLFPMFYAHDMSQWISTFIRDIFVTTPGTLKTIMSGAWGVIADFLHHAFNGSEVVIER
ncbi:MAG: hypothetical protein WCW14_01135 [Candidatus Paceibacterota bacterium]|jgi:fumarate reductase subunit D